MVHLISLISIYIFHFLMHDILSDQDISFQFFLHFSAVLDEYSATNISFFDTRLPLGKTALEILEKDGDHYFVNSTDTPVIIGWGAWDEVLPGEEKKLAGPPPDGAKAYKVVNVDAVFARAKTQVRYRLAAGAKD